MGGGNVVYNFEFVTSEKSLPNRLISPRPRSSDMLRLSSIA